MGFLGFLEGAVSMVFFLLGSPQPHLIPTCEFPNSSDRLVSLEPFVVLLILRSVQNRVRPGHVLQVHFRRRRGCI